MAQPAPPMPPVPAPGQADAQAVAAAVAIRSHRALSRAQTMQEKGEDHIRVFDITAAASAQQQGANLPPNANLPQQGVAQVMQAQLAPIHAQLGQLTTRQGQNTTRLGQLTTRLGQMTTQLGQMTTQLGQMTTQLGQITTQLGQITDSQAAMQAQLTNQRRRAQNARSIEAPPQHLWALVPLVKERPSPAGVANAAPVGALPPPGLFPGTWARIEQLNNAQLNRLEDFYGETFGQPGALARRREAFKAFIRD
ncbi:hypothetical protein ABPG77_001818 [Micractinium sp. CCAP 211/92]